MHMHLTRITISEVRQIQYYYHRNINSHNETYIKDFNIQWLSYANTRKLTYLLHSHVIQIGLQQSNDHSILMNRIFLNKIQGVY